MVTLKIIFFSLLLFCLKLTRMQHKTFIIKTKLLSVYSIPVVSQKVNKQNNNKINNKVRYLLVFGGYFCCSHLKIKFHFKL